MAERTTSRRPLLMWIGLGFAALIGLILLVVVIGLLWLRGEGGRDFVESRIEGMEFAGQSVELDGLNGSVLGAFEIDRLVVSGQEGDWLVAQDISVDWSPRALLSQRLDVDAIRIGDLDMLDRPVLVPSESGGGSPVTSFDIDGIDLPNIRVAEPVLGRTISLSAKGDLQHGLDGGGTELTAQSDQGDRIVADLDWSRLLVLSGEAQIEGAPDGLIARLLRLDPEQSVSANVTTQDSVTRVSAQIDDRSVAEFSIERGQSTVALSGTLETQTVPLLEPLTPFLGGPAQLQALLPLDEGATASIDLRAPELTLIASGMRSDGTIQLDRIRLKAEQGLQSVADGRVGMDRLVAEGRAVLGETYSFEGNVDATDLSYRDYEVDRLTGPATLSYAGGSLDFDLNLTGQAAASLMARANGARLKAVGTVDVSDRTVSFSRADVDLPGIVVRGRGAVGYGKTVTAEFSGRYDVDTAVLREGPSARLVGEASVRQTAQGPVIDLSGRATRIANIPDAALPVVPNGLTYEAEVRTKDGAFVVPSFTARSDRLQATGAGRWQDGQLTSQIDYRVDQYEFAAVSAEDIRGRVNLSGPPSEIAFQSDLTAGLLNTVNLDITDAVIEVDGTYSNGVTQLSGALKGDSPQGPVTTRGNIRLEDGNWSVSGLEGALGDLSVTGGLSGIGGDLAQIRGDLVLSGTSPLIPAEAIEADIKLGDARVNVDARLIGVNYWRLENGTVRLLAEGPRSDVAFDLSVAGDTLVRDIERPFTLEAKGQADLRAESLSGQAVFDATLGDMSLAGTGTAQRGPEGWSGQLNSDGLGGSIEAGLQAGEGVRFDVETLSVARIAAILARPVTEGSVSATGQFGIVDDRVEGAAELTLADLRSPISDAEAITIVSDVSLQNDRLIVTTGATEGGLSGRARLEGTVETRAQMPYLIYPPATPLQGQANLNGEIGPVVELFLPPRTDVAGMINTDLSFTIPTTATGVQGRIVLEEGRFEQGALGLNLEDIAIVAELSGDAITVPTLSARGAKGGSLQGSGRLGLIDGAGTVDIEARELLVLSRREGMAEVSGTLNLSRTAELLRLGGELRVTDAELDIGHLPEPGLPTLDVDFGDAEEEDQTRSFASSATELDIDIVSNSRIAVKGRGLDADMSLDASVRGAFDAPIVTGEMTIERGRFDFLSKRFEFRESRVLLREDTLQSILLLDAVRRTPDLTAVVEIRGTLDRPEIELTSEPNLPEDEVLARILFGRSPTQLSAIETARLAAALTQLSGGSGFDLFGSLENAIGLDTLEIGQNDIGQTQLATGKYLSDDIYLEIRTTAEGTPGVAVEWQVRDNVALEAETLSNERQRLSVQWKRDFD